MKCDKCGSERVIKISVKLRDGRRGYCKFGGVEVEHIPDIPNLEAGGYLCPSVCMDCGKVQGFFPVVFELKSVEEEQEEVAETEEQKRQYLLAELLEVHQKIVEKKTGVFPVKVGGFNNTYGREQDHSKLRALIANKRQELAGLEQENR